MGNNRENERKSQPSKKDVKKPNPNVIINKKFLSGSAVLLAAISTVGASTVTANYYKSQQEEVIPPTSYELYFENMDSSNKYVLPEISRKLLEEYDYNIKNYKTMKFMQENNIKVSNDLQESFDTSKKELYHGLNDFREIYLKSIKLQVAQAFGLSVEKAFESKVKYLSNYSGKSIDLPDNVEGIPNKISDSRLESLSNDISHLDKNLAKDIQKIKYIDALKNYNYNNFKFDELVSIYDDFCNSLMNNYTVDEKLNIKLESKDYDYSSEDLLNYNINNFNRLIEMKEANNGNLKKSQTVKLSKSSKNIMLKLEDLPDRINSLPDSAESSLVKMMFKNCKEGKESDNYTDLEITQSYILCHVLCKNIESSLEKVSNKDTSLEIE